MKHHIPILCKEVIENLVTVPEGIYMDCTVGFGGHSEEILSRLNNKGYLIGIDIDPYALKTSNDRLSKKYKNFSLYNCSYVEFPKILEKNKLKKVDGLLFDIGISSYQVDEAHRGFSYNKEGPLDMRFNQENQKFLSAKELLYNISEKNLSNIIKIYGEERYHKRIAKSIINAKNKKQMETTFDLRNSICNVVPKINSIKILSRVFQAIRIALNDEINILKTTLKLSYKYLNKGGRIAFITFHSIEDRIVKHFLKDSVIYKNTTYEIEFKENNKKFNLINKKPILPSHEEIKTNSRSRSAKLRIAERI